MNIKRVANVFLFPTGVLAVCDADGKQIPELQGTYSINKHKRIMLEALPNCEFKGFEILPHGFNQTVLNWYDHFKNQNLSWWQINSL